LPDLKKKKTRKKKKRRGGAFGKTGVEEELGEYDVAV
jgi:hypothetical protein